MSPNNPYPRLFPDGATIDHDRLAAHGASRRLYAMFIIARSGSTWLTEMARNSGALGCPHEWLNPEFTAGDARELGQPTPRALGLGDINDYISAALAFSASENGAAGAQFSWPQTNWLRELSPQLSLAPFRAVFYLRRRDLAAQAVSLARSVASGLFHSHLATKALEDKHRNAGYDGALTIDMFRHLADCEVQFEAMFAACGASPVRLVYEDFQLSPQIALDAMSSALGLSAPARYRGESTKVMRDKASDKWIDRFHADHGEEIARTLAVRPKF